MQEGSATSMQRMRRRWSPPVSGEEAVSKGALSGWYSRMFTPAHAHAMVSTTLLDQLTVRPCPWAAPACARSSRPDSDPPLG